MLEKLAPADIAVERKIHAGLTAIENISGASIQRIKKILDSPIVKNLGGFLLGASAMKNGADSLMYNASIVSLLVYTNLYLQKTLAPTAKMIEEELKTEDCVIKSEIRGNRIFFVAVLGTIPVLTGLNSWDTLSAILLGLGGSALLPHPLLSTYLSSHPGTKQKHPTKNKFMDAFSKIFPAPQPQLIPIPVKR